MYIDLTTIVETPIETGWQEVQRNLPKDLNEKAIEPLRIMFFTGARHYREMIKIMFELEDGDMRVKMIENLAKEMKEWE